MQKYRVKNISKSLVTLALLGVVHRIESGSSIEVDMTSTQANNVSGTSLFIVECVSPKGTEEVKEMSLEDSCPDSSNVLQSQLELISSKQIDTSELPNYDSYRTSDLRAALTELGYDSSKLRRKEMIALLMKGK